MGHTRNSRSLFKRRANSVGPGKGLNLYSHKFSEDVGPGLYFTESGILTDLGSSPSCVLLSCAIWGKPPEPAEGEQECILGRVTARVKQGKTWDTFSPWYVTAPSVANQFAEDTLAGTSLVVQW